MAAKLIERGYNVAQIGAFNDKKLSVPGVIDLTGKMTFKQHLGFFSKKCIGYVGNDSGPAYLAAESGIPTLLVMGSTQNLGLDKGPSVGPCHPNVKYIHSAKPENNICKPVPCYTHCLIGKQGGCVADVDVKTVYDGIIGMLGGATLEDNSEKANALKTIDGSVKEPSIVRVS